MDGGRGGWLEGKAGIVVVQLLGHVQLFATLWTAARQASLSFTITWSLLKLVSIESVMLSNHLTPCDGHCKRLGSNGTWCLQVGSFGLN